ncbi:MAG: carbohydrate kinase [Pedobacter sp.]|nr:MAG: carbohydrate kinase [Pedobacter sp.]
MRNQEIKPTVFCFGEVLWDIFPDGARAGGAPFNVAYHLMRMGVESRMISRTGDDDLGRELLAKVSAWNIPLVDSQVDLEYPTGTVLATIDEHNEAHYDIIKPVAWDYIAWREDYLEKVSKADAFVFGSLVARNDVSRDTLFKLVDVAKYKVFDVNIRLPYFSLDVAKELLVHADLVKMNKAELRAILDYLGKEYKDEHDGIRYVQEKFDIGEVIISKGSKGAVYYNREEFYESPAVSVTVKDTVGSGDSFLAGFISKKLMGGSAEEAMKQAAALGAFITSQEGACPDYTIEDFQAFCKEKGAL